MKRWMPVLAIIAMLMVCSAAWACPMCKDSIPNSDAASATMVPGAVNNSIFLMFAAFAGCLGLISWTLVQGARGSRQRQARGFLVDQRPMNEDDRT
jgi:hypothetical protein